MFNERLHSCSVKPRQNYTGSFFWLLQFTGAEDTIFPSRRIGRENVLKRVHISALDMALNIALRWSYQKHHSKTKMKLVYLSNISFYLWENKQQNFL